MQRVRMAKDERGMMNIANYWKTTPQAREDIKQQVEQADLESYAEEHGLVIYQGKAIKPEHYPCDCEKENPYHCFEENKDLPDSDWSKSAIDAFLKAQEDGMCPCPCHSTWQGD
jgi:hypothetical protein